MGSLADQSNIETVILNECWRSDYFKIMNYFKKNGREKLGKHVQIGIMRRITDYNGT